MVCTLPHSMPMSSACLDNACPTRKGIRNDKVDMTQGTRPAMKMPAGAASHIFTTTVLVDSSLDPTQCHVCKIGSSWTRNERDKLMSIDIVTMVG